MVHETSKIQNSGNSEVMMTTPATAQKFGETLQSKVRGETTADTRSLLSASIDNRHSDSVKGIILGTDLGAVKPVSMRTKFQYHVLAVDDSVVDQRVIEKLLKASSYKVTTVNSAVRALDVLGLSETCPSSLKKLDINLIMSDYFMPEMTGYDLLKRVKAKTSALKEIPVVLMSSENDSHRIKRCLAEGAEAFLTKPVQLADVKRLRGHIRRRRSRSSSGTCTNLTGGTMDRHEVSWTQ